MKKRSVLEAVFGTNDPHTIMKLLFGRDSSGFGVTLIISAIGLLLLIFT